MPRMARIKYSDAIYHIMARSITEINLFKFDEDKKRYLIIVKEYQKIYSFKVYAYCLMNNHVHLIIDANGADISSIMHSINFKYAQYFNRKYNRHGHLFQDRFKSKIVKNEKYLINLSAYIHNNAVDIQQYANCPEKYQFSSLAVYLGLRKDTFQILDYKYILSLFSSNIKSSRNRYINLVLISKEIINIQDGEFDNEKTEYRSEKTILARDYKIDDIIDLVTKRMNIDKAEIYLKYCRNSINAKALLILLLRNLCNMKCRDICKVLGNITQSRVSKLCSVGVALVESNRSYASLIREIAGCDI